MIIKGLSNLSIIKKAFIYLLVTCILPTMILGVIAVNKTNDVFKLEINKFSNDLMLSKQKNIELIMQNIESLILNISSLDDIHNTLINENNDSYNKLSAQVKIGYILSGYSNLKGLVSIDVFSMSDMHYHFGDTLNVENIKSDLKQTLFKEAIHSDKVVVWNGIEDNVNVNSAYSKVITASKVIKVLDSNTMIEKPIGFLLVNYDVNAFTENISDSNLKDTQQFIIDNKNRIVFCSDKNQTGSEISPLFIKKLNEKSGNFADKINGEKMIVNYTRSSKSGWIVLSLIPSKVLKAKMSTISNNMIISQ